MEAVAQAMLGNALLVSLLAPAVAVMSRTIRSSAMIHSLWLLLLAKLVMPPVVLIPLALPLVGKSLDGTAVTPTVAKPDFEANRPAEVSVGPLPKDWRNAPAGVLGPATSKAAPMPPSQGLRRNRRGEPIGESIVEPSGSEFETKLAPEVAVATVDRRARLGLSLTTEPRAAESLGWPALFLGLVGSGAFVYWSLAAIRIRRLHRLLGKIKLAPAQWQAEASEAARQVGLDWCPRVWSAPGRLPPMIWALGGHIRLLLPGELWPSLDPDQRAALLIHELAHLRRRDHWTRWFELAVTGLYWWLPTAWWASRQRREAEEQCCDAWVLRTMPHRAHRYALALLWVLDFVSCAPPAAAAASSAATGGNRHAATLKRRMRMIVRSTSSTRLGQAGRLAVLSAVALALPLAPSWARLSSDAASPSREERIDLRAKEDLRPHHVSRMDSPTLIALQDPEREDPENPESDDSSQKSAAESLERQVRELAENLGRELSPLGEELRKALEKATSEVNEALKKEGMTPEDLRAALEKARDAMRRAFEEGGPIQREWREAFEKAREELEKAREELREAAERARQEFRESMRYRLRELEEREAEEPRAEAEAEPRSSGDRDRSAELNDARREIRRLEQQLRQAVRRLEQLQRQEDRAPRGPRRSGRGPGSGGPPPRPPAPPEPPRERPAPPTRPETEELQPTSPFSESDEPSVRGRGAGPRGMMRGPRMMEEPEMMRGPIMEGPGMMRGPRMMEGPGMVNPRVDRRLRDLEEKLDRLLNELQQLKGDKKQKAKKDNGDDDNGDNDNGDDDNGDNENGDDDNGDDDNGDNDNGDDDNGDNVNGDDGNGDDENGDNGNGDDDNGDDD